MFSHVTIMRLIVIPCLLFGLGATATAQNGRLVGTVAYAIPGRIPFAAQYVRVFAVGSYVQSETRTDSNGNFIMGLPAGSYRIVAQGDGRFGQPQVVIGNVRANTDSIIIPNPLYLVPRGSSTMTNPVLGQPTDWDECLTAISQKGFLPEILAQKIRTGQLEGKVMRRRGKGEAAMYVRVVITGSLISIEIRTNSDGTFITSPLPIGIYKISIPAEAGFKEGDASGEVMSGKTTKINPDTIWLQQK